MGDSFETLTRAYRAGCNVVVSSAGRKPAKFMKRKSGMPFVEGLPIGKEQTEAVLQAVRDTLQDRKDRKVWGEFENTGRFSVPEDGILVIGEEIFARSLADAINRLPSEARNGRKACPLWPDEDEGMPEAELITAVRGAHTVIADPLYKIIARNGAPDTFIPFPHEAYSGRIYRSSIPVFCGPDYSVDELLQRS